MAQRAGDSRQLPARSGCAVPHGAAAEAEMAADKAAGECGGSGRGPAVPAPGLRRPARRDARRCGKPLYGRVPCPSAEAVACSGRGAAVRGPGHRRVTAGPCAHGARRALGERRSAVAPSWPGRARWGGPYVRVGGGSLCVCVSRSLITPTEVELLG